MRPGLDRKWHNHFKQALQHFLSAMKTETFCALRQFEAGTNHCFFAVIVPCQQPGVYHERPDVCGEFCIIVALKFREFGLNKQECAYCAEKVSALPVQTFTLRLCNYTEINQKLWVWLIVLIRRGFFFCYITFPIDPPPPTPQQMNDAQREMLPVVSCRLHLDYLSFKRLFSCFTWFQMPDFWDLKWPK